MTTVEEARAVLKENGYVVLREKSYRQAQRRQHIADALRAYAEYQVASTERWAREDLGRDNRRLRERLTFVYGVARAKGATPEELRGPSVDAPNVWDSSVAPGGYVCGECGTPTESEPCNVHQPNAYDMARSS